MTAAPRRLPIGVDVAAGGVTVRIWAPGHRGVEVVLAARGTRASDALRVSLQAAPGGYFEAFVPGVLAGDRYWLSVDGGRSVSDPASRFQPDGPHGPSEVVDPDAFAWSDDRWPGPTLGPTAIYEIHVGAFTPEGTFRSAATQLADLAELGVGIVEVMPIADFPGRFGWGYDGVNLYAPSHLYGRPDDFRHFVDEAHALGLGVILDVVYNHVGPDGNFLPQFSRHYLSRRHQSEWGATYNFDDEGSDGVREFVVGNARYWIDEFHLDGLRLDATQQMFDDSPEHVIAAIARAVREAGGQRRTVLIAENERQDTRLVRDPSHGGYGLDALWNDDLHHSAVVALTGHAEAYYSDHRGTPQELVSAAKHGFLFQGEYYSWQKQRRGTPALDLSPRRFVSFIQNHDQVANSAQGERIDRLSSPGQLRAMTAYLLLGPATPLLFMGQEFAASSPFLYFADLEAELARGAWAGRRDFLRQFPSLALPEVLDAVPDPADRSTFERSRLDLAERMEPAHAAWLRLHSDLLRLRRSDPAFLPDEPGLVDGAVLNDRAFVLRFFESRRDPARLGERLLVVNLGGRWQGRPLAEPLLAPPLGTRWQAILSTDDVRYGGRGSAEPETPTGWVLPAEAAVVLAPVPADEGPRSSGPKA